MSGQVFAVTEPHSQVWTGGNSPALQTPPPRALPELVHIARCWDSPMPSWGLLGATTLLGPLRSQLQPRCGELLEQRSSGKARHKVVHLRPSEE